MSHVPAAPSRILTLTLPTPDATTRLAQFIAPHLRQGDVLLLDGPIGAGKTHFARALIQARLQAVGRAEDVPSPTFTLVQVYETDLEIWHADLYRLTHPHDALDLGLDQAMQDALCLIEWPDRLGRLRPSDALTLRFAPVDDLRHLTISAVAPRWQSLFADLAGWRDAG